MILSIFSKLFGGAKQSMGGAGGRADAFINTLKTELNITADQETKIKAALQEFFQEKRSIKQGGGGKDAMRESKQDFKQDIINALTPEQQQKFMANINMYKQLLKR
jgi:Spy/CpxP family protein refolding chaperone